MSEVSVKLSQDSLFFPLPFTNATIENVVQIRNLHPSNPANPLENMLGFKVLSAVRHRYLVKPPSGFIPAGESITVNFSIDPESLAKSTDPEVRKLPTKDTRDNIFIDFALIDGDAASRHVTPLVQSLQKPNASGSIKTFFAKPNRELAAAAAAFWSERGPVSSKQKKSGERPDGLRRRLGCVFARKDEVPQSLVVCLKSDSTRPPGQNNNPSTSSSSPPAQPPVPTSRPPTTRTTNSSNRSPPQNPPVKFNGRSALKDSSSNNSSHGQAKSIRFDPSLSDAVASSSATSSAATKPKDASWSSIQDYVVKIMGHKIPLPAIAALLLISLLCGIFEQSGFFYWLIVG